MEVGARQDFDTLINMKVSTLRRVLITLKYSFYLLLLKLSNWKIQSVPVFDGINVSAYVAIAVPHTSYYDFYISYLASKYDNYNRELLGYPTQKTVILVAKEHTQIPIIRHFKEQLDMVSVDRENPKNNLAMLKAIKNYVKEGNVRVLIAPEGTRQATPEWNAGFYTLAKMNKIPVYPCGLDYGTKTFRADGFLDPKEMDYDTMYKRVHTSFKKSYAKNQDMYLSYNESQEVLAIEKKYTPDDI
jgi:1-acyl-sn-glycerol-3-phosphate acyltransferase